MSPSGKKASIIKSRTFLSRVINLHHEPGVEDVAVWLKIKVLPGISGISGVEDILLGRRIRHHLKRKTLVRQIPGTSFDTLIPPPHCPNSTSGSGSGAAGME
jgi:hypothetical protein